MKDKRIFEIRNRQCLCHFRELPVHEQSKYARVGLAEVASRADPDQTMLIDFIPKPVSKNQKKGFISVGFGMQLVVETYMEKLGHHDLDVVRRFLSLSAKVGGLTHAKSVKMFGKTNVYKQVRETTRQVGRTKRFFEAHVE